MQSGKKNKKHEWGKAFIFIHTKHQISPCRSKAALNKLTGEEEEEEEEKKKKKNLRKSVMLWKIVDVFKNSSKNLKKKKKKRKGVAMGVHTRN